MSNLCTLGWIIATGTYTQYILSYITTIIGINRKCSHTLVMGIDPIRYIVSPYYNQ